MCCGAKEEENKGPHSKKPIDNAFKQQKLKAWQPLLTPKWVISTFFIVGCTFLPVGIVVLVESNKVVEFTARYDSLGSTSCNNDNTTSCWIDISIDIDEDMDAPIYFYYKLTNFYQNHRRYVKSRDDEQLRGESSDLESCDPLENYNGKTLYPCGLIANSFFNDSFINATVIRGGVNNLLEGNNWDGTGIAWDSDVEDKFKRRSLNSDETGIGPGGYEIWTAANNEDFIVWMRTAGLPTFKKLHRRIEDTSLKAGDTFTVSIENTFPVSDFDGEKSIVLSTTSDMIGGKNEFLGWAYIVVGIVCLLLGFAFLIKNWAKPRELGDMSYYKFPSIGDD